MAVEFDGSEQRIDYGSINAEYSTITFWLYVTTINNANMDISYSRKYEFIRARDDGAGITNAITYVKILAPTSRMFYANNAITTDAWYHIAVIPSVPTIYSNGVSKSITVVNAGSGTATQLQTYIGTKSGGNAVIGQVQDLRYYNRILSAGEVGILANSRLQNVILNGLVFWAPLNGAAGLPIFDGATLGESNTLIDQISGVHGVPVGNPVGRGNTIQRIY